MSKKPNIHLSAGVFGMPWLSARHALEEALPGGTWRRLTFAKAIHSQYVINGPSKLFDFDLEMKTPVRFLFEEDALIGIVVRAKCRDIELLDELGKLSDQLGPFDHSERENFYDSNGHLWNLSWRSGGIVVNIVITQLRSSWRRLNVVIGYNRS